MAAIVLTYRRRLPRTEGVSKIAFLVSWDHETWKSVKKRKSKFYAINPNFIVYWTSKSMLSTNTVHIFYCVVNTPLIVLHIQDKFKPSLVFMLNISCHFCILNIFFKMTFHWCFYRCLYLFFSVAKVERTLLWSSTQMFFFSVQVIIILLTLILHCSTLFFPPALFFLPSACASWCL